MCRHLNRLSISGVKDNVNEAYTKAMEIINDFEQAVICSEYVMWKYFDKHTKTFTDFPLRANNNIEKAYKVSYNYAL